MSVIEIRDIRKYYGSGSGRTEVLHGLNLTIEHGEFVSITGPSGSGKSTLMNILGLLDTADEGTYMINGHSVSDMHDHKLAELRLSQIGFIFQSFNLISSLSSFDNIQIPLVYSKIRKSERQRRASELLNYLGIGEKMRAKPKELSGGQQQRVAIARALVNRPSLILADEPTGNLDTASGQAIMQILKKLNQQGATVVMITHDPHLAAETQRTIIIRDGAIVSDTRNNNGPVAPTVQPQQPPQIDRSVEHAL